jgi:hypothetical protein
MIRLFGLPLPYLFYVGALHLDEAHWSCTSIAPGRAEHLHAKFIYRPNILNNLTHFCTAVPSHP